MKHRSLIKGVGFAITFAFVLFFAAAVSTSECEATDYSTFTIECGEGHEEAAITVRDFLDGHSAYYFTNVTRNGTVVEATCSSGLRISSIKLSIGEALMGGFMSNAQFVIANNSNNNSNELFWKSMVGLKPITGYQNEKEFQAEVRDNAETSIGNISDRTLYILWEKPFDKHIKVSIDTPYCSSTEAPTVKCDTVTLTPSSEAGKTFREPAWYSTKPEGYLNYPWENNYTGTLEGGKQYYAYATLGAPWGYYFPKNFSDVTFEMRSGDVWDATSDDEYENLGVGCWITAGHVWGDWTVKKKPTALNAGLEQRVCEYGSSHLEERTLPATGVKGLLLAQEKAKSSNKMVISWTKVTGAEGYDIFFAKCNTKESKTKLKLVKTVKGNKTFTWTKGGLKKKTAYKTQVKAFAYKNGKKTYVRTSPDAHAFTSGGTSKYTNPKSVSVNKTTVTLKKGGTFKIKGKVTKLNAKKKLISKAHGPVLRYRTSNKSIATVSSSGVITGKSAGKCTVYALSVNGLRKAIAVTVK